MKKDNYSDQLILHIAEEEFIEKGLHGTKTIVIARKAKIPLPTLHTYFKTKEDIFLMVFVRKLRLISVALLSFYDKLPLEAAMRRVIEQHFDILARNPRLVRFLYSEIISNEEIRKFLLEHLSGRLNNIFNSIEKIIETEVAKGTIKPIKASDLLLNVISLNVFTFVAYRTMRDTMPDKSLEYFERFLSERRENNVQFILNAIKP